jgi:hypothetical protein
MGRGGRCGTNVTCRGEVEEARVLLYADRPGVRLRQVLGDLTMVAVTLAALWLARELRRAVLALDGAAVRLRDSGETVTSGARSAAGAVEGIPGVGSALASPFETIAGAGGELTAAGQQTSEAVHTLALLLPAVLAGLIAGYVLFRLLPARVRWVREAAEVRRLLASAGAARLLAHRAVATRPLRDLRREVGDPAAALAAGRWAELAGVELHALGLRRSRLAA